jgi:hypothetical protein
MNGFVIADAQTQQHRYSFGWEATNKQSQNETEFCRGVRPVCVRARTKQNSAVAEYYE